MEYIVMDMEWNQALTYSGMVKDPVFLTGEIIQIGAIKLNQALEVLDSFNERIAPQYYTELHPKVAEITKLSNRDLQKGKGSIRCLILSAIGVAMTLCSWSGGRKIFVFCERIWISIILIPALCPRVSIYRTSLWIKLHTIQSNTHWPMHWRSSARFHLIPTMP